MLNNGEPSTTSAGEKALLGAVGTGAVLVLVFLTGGALSGLVFGDGWAFPDPGEWLTTVGGVLKHADHPAAGYPAALRDRVPGAVPFWSVTGAMLVLALFAAAFAGVAVAVRTVKNGMSTRAQVRKAMTGADRTAPFGRYAGVPVATMSGDAVVVIAPQQSGKTTRLAAPAIIDAPGPVVATSTKADLVDLTAFAREQLHEGSRVSVFDADGVTGWPSRAKWCPVRGCEDPQLAQVRAAAMVAARPLGKGGSVEFFNTAATRVLRCLLHAAALGGFNILDVRRWANDAHLEEPYTLLERGEAAPGWAADLRSTAQTSDSRTAGNINATLTLVLDALAMPSVREQVTPATGEGFDVDAFLARPADTLYVMSSGTSGGTGPIATAFVASVVYAAKKASQRSHTRKLDPVLRLVLDEAPNGCPLPDLDELLADGGGRGLNTWVFAQAFAQLEDRWGDRAGIIWGATSVKMLLGGCTETDWLRRISDLIGNRKVGRQQVTRGRGGASVSLGTEREPVMSVKEISTLAPGKALLIYRGTVRAIVDVDGYWQRKDHKLFNDSVTKAQQLTDRAPATERKHQDADLATTAGGAA